MPKAVALSIIGFFAALGAVGAQTPPASAAGAFDGTYRAVSATNVNATYTDRNGRMGQCARRRPPGPLHVVNGEARYTNSTGYKLRGTVGPQGELTMGLVAPSNSSNAGSRALNLNVTGQIDSNGTVHARQVSNSCSYDFVWQKAHR